MKEWWAWIGVAVLAVIILAVLALRAMDLLIPEVATAAGAAIVVATGMSFVALTFSPLRRKRHRRR
ncbi:hypothetical protein [Microbacterium sp. NPDC055683]